MPEYTFYIDQKVMVWERSTYVIKAECFEDALKEADKLYEEPIYEDHCGFIGQETLCDSSVDMSPSQNNGVATRELIHYLKGEHIEIKNNAV